MDLSFLGKKTLGSAYTDNTQEFPIEVSTRDLINTKKVPILIKPNGGFVMVF